jgi:hypothetical protein
MAVPNGFVPANVAVKRNRVGNIDVDRLARRWAFLVGQVHFQSGDFRSRMDWAMRAAEMSAIQRELVRRGVSADFLDSIRGQVANVAAFL